MSARPMFVALIGAAALLGCDDDDGFRPPIPTAFTVEVENVSTVYEFPTSGTFTTAEGQSEPGPLLPGQTFVFELDGAPGHRLSFATMFGQSNDLFYAPDEDGIALYDAEGQPISGDVTDQLVLWDAGTEANQEPGLGEDQAPRQSAPDTGAEDPDNTVRVAEDEYGNLPPTSEVIQVTLTSLGDARFRLRIENVGDATTLMTSDGESHPAPVSPGVWVVHAGTAPLFTAGQPDRGEGLERIAEEGDVTELAASVEDRTGLTSPLAPGVFAVHTESGVLFESGQPDRGEGLEALAEDGVPTGLASSLSGAPDVSASGAFAVPTGASDPAPIFPGETYGFDFEAAPGDRLSLATMLVQSNDLFFAFDEAGIALFDADGDPVSGDVTAELALWDAGTEVNQAPGFGLDQAPRQAGPDTGADEGGTIRVLDDAFTYPSVAEVIRVTITPVP